VQTIDPMTQNRSTVVSAFLTMFGYVLILATDQHHSILRAVARSYATFPIGTALPAGRWFETLMEASGEIFVIGWKIAFPVFVATFLVEVTVALISRAQPEVNAMVVTAPLKLLIGIFVLGASLAFLPGAIDAFMDMTVLEP
jgi:flagellar biosynthetic protein FliR